MARLDPYRKLAPFSSKELLPSVNALLRERPHLALTERTLRYYITEGVIPPPEGPPKFARYSFLHLASLAFIRLMQDQGIGLDRIKSDLSRAWSKGGGEEEERLAAMVNSLLERSEDLEMEDLAPPRAPRESVPLGFAMEARSPRTGYGRKSDRDEDEMTELREAIQELTQAVRLLREEVASLRKDQSVS